MAKRNGAAIKTNGESKSSIVRKYLEKHPGASNKLAAGALAAHGIKAFHVAGVKNQLKNSAGKQTRHVQDTVRNGYSRSLSSHAAAFVKDAGSIDNAIQLLETIKAVREVVTV